MPLSRLVFPFAVAIVTLGLSCSEPTALCACPPEGQVAIVYGRVTAGTPAVGLAGTRVTLTSFDDACTRPAVPGGGAATTVTTDANGDYRAVVRPLIGPGIPSGPDLQSCVEVTSGGVAIDVLVTARYESEPLDSVRVNLHVP